MSNSIWHTTKESPESVQKCPFCGEELSYAQEIDGGFEILTCDCPYGIWFFGNDKMWNFLDALIAQADKAERLEETLTKIATASVRDKVSTLIDVACMALNPELDEIKQLIKGE